MDARKQRREIAEILAAGCWRLLRSDAAKPLKQARLKTPESSESRCYAVPPE